jgi:hypothetical protein
LQIGVSTFDLQFYAQCDVVTPSADSIVRALSAVLATDDKHSRGLITRGAIQSDMARADPAPIAGQIPIQAESLERAGSGASTILDSSLGRARVCRWRRDLVALQ